MKIGPLSVRELGRGDGPAILLCHGYGAPGDDLVPLGRVIDAGSGVRWFFPEAPLEVDLGFGRPRAWWPIDMMRMQVSNSHIEIVNGKRDDREASGNRIERRKGPAFEDDQIDAAQIEMGAMLIVHHQLQSDDIPIEMCSRRNIFGPQADDGKFWLHSILPGKQNDQRNERWS